MTYELWRRQARLTRNGPERGLRGYVIMERCDFTDGARRWLGWLFPDGPWIVDSLAEGIFWDRSAHETFLTRGKAERCYERLLANLAERAASYGDWRENETFEETWES